MWTLEEMLKDMNWFDIMFLKSLLEGRKSTKDVCRDFERWMPVYVGSGKSIPKRSTISVKSKVLASRGLIRKVRDVETYYEIEEKYKSDVVMLVMAYMSIFDKSNKVVG